MDLNKATGIRSAKLVKFASHICEVVKQAQRANITKMQTKILGFQVLRFSNTVPA